MALSKKDMESIAGLIKQVQATAIPTPSPSPSPKPEPQKPVIQSPEPQAGIGTHTTEPQSDKDEMPIVNEQFVGGNGSVQKEKKHFGLNFWQKKDLTGNPATSYLITMLHGNGTLDHFVVKTANNCFFYKKNYYHLNKLQAWYDINNNQTRMLYHENYVEPLDTKVYIEGDRAWLKVTPEMLKPFVEMEYVKVLTESDALSKWLKVAVYLMIANLLFTAIMAISALIQTGVFNNLVPGT
jgi:hypothetical protein